MHLSTLVPGMIAMLSTAISAQNVILYKGASFQGDSWTFTGDPFVCATVDKAVYGAVNSAALVFDNPPGGFVCRLFSSDNCVPTTWITELAVLFPNIPALSNPDVRSVQCNVYNGWA